MGEKKKKDTSNTTVCLSLKKSLHCKSEPSDVHDPTVKKKGSSCCLESISNLKKCMTHRSCRRRRRPPENPAANCSPISIGSGGGGGAFVGTRGTRNSGNIIFTENEFSEMYTNGENGGAKCHTCGEQFVNWENLESHHLSNHAVTELTEDDSSRKIVEIICGSSKLNPESRCITIERVLKIHNTQKTLTRFEDYREMVKTKANEHPNKHPRCLADGNELMMFYGTILECSLGINGSSGLCASGRCCVCIIIRNGFPAKREIKLGDLMGVSARREIKLGDLMGVSANTDIKLGQMGVFTASTSGRAFESIEIDCENEPLVRKALIVCRVIAGRVHLPLRNILESSNLYDSLADKVGSDSEIEELYLLSPKALLPCFVVVCKA
ncbi:hypothetical protein ABFS82_08G179300 [Erythranthe guttata]